MFAPRVSDLDLSAVPISEGGDYSPEKLRKAVHKSRIVGDVVQHYLRIAPGKLGVTFAVDVESAREIVQAYRAANVTAELVTAETPDLLRAQILRRFRDREVMQLVNVDLFGEGFNLPAIEVVAMARPTQSFSLFAQQFGRALRPLPGKTHAIIIDHVGNVERHGLPDKKREWTLDRRERRNSSGPSDLIPMTVCIQCTSAYERYRGACPYCGFVREPAGRGAPEFVDGVLEELDPMVLARMRGEIDPPLKFPVGATGPIRARLTATHAERVEAQRKLRIATGVWGALKEREGLTVAEGQRTFYFRYGIDLMSAWALNASDADKLRAHIEAEIGVVPT